MAPLSLDIEQVGSVWICQRLGCFPTTKATKEVMHKTYATPVQM